MKEIKPRLKNPLPAGEVINKRYRVKTCIGMGSMGCVYLVSDLQESGAKKALKVLNNTSLGDHDAVPRFLREASLTAKVDHENVVKVFDSGEDRGLLFYVMEYLDALPLHECDVFRRFDEEAMVEIASQICSALIAIHQVGIVHRDLKPENILVLLDGRIRITDFGVARPEQSTLTAHNAVVGTLQYIAPECWSTSEKTHSVDLYALGVILFEMTTGDYPHKAKTPTALMKQQKSSSKIHAKKKNREVSNWLDQLICRLLSNKPESRPESAEVVLKMLKEGEASYRPSSAGRLIALTESMIIGAR